MMNHVQSPGMELRQIPPRMKPDIPERLERWSERAKEFGKLLAVPSDILRGKKLSLGEIDLIEDRFKKSMAERLKPYLRPGMRICDVGCGPARLARHLIPLMRQSGGGTYFGVDFNKDILHIAENYL